MKRIFLLLALLLAIGCIVGALVGWNRWQGLAQPHNLPAERIFHVRPGESAAGIFYRLHELQLIRDPKALAWRLRLGGDAASVQIGEYRVQGPASDMDIAQMLLEGRVLLHELTIPEGLRFDEIALLFDQAGLADAAAFLGEALDPARIASHDDAAQDLEGYLFPETYHLPSSMNAAEIVSLMVDRFLVSVGEDYADRAAAVGLSLQEAVTLASMIEEETSLPEERTTISRVFHNRLRLGMRMQCDPTVRYAWYRKGEPVSRLLYKHLPLESPWNTYVIYGLPQGPIANPGLAALEAAVDPAEGGELYFVAAPGGGGGHVFSRSLKEHERAVRSWRSYVRSSR